MFKTISLLNTTLPVQVSLILAAATSCLQAYWKERTNWFERTGFPIFLGGLGGKVITGAVGKTG